LERSPTDRKTPGLRPGLRSVAASRDVLNNCASPRLDPSIAGSALLYPAMKPIRLGLLITAIGIAVFSSLYAQTTGNNIDKAFQTFWAAPSPDEAERIAEAVATSGVTFDAALKRLKTGRAYTMQKTGVFFSKNKTKDGIEHYYALNVPVNYDPSR